MNFQNKKKLQIVLFVIVAVLTLGIGYASINAINLIISGNATASVNQENFVVHFVAADNIMALMNGSGCVRPLLIIEINSAVSIMMVSCTTVMPIMLVVLHLLPVLDKKIII